MKNKKTLILIIAFAIISLTGIFAFIPSASTEAFKITNLISLSDSIDTKSYTCPMHPEVISDKPGECPKCGMDLILKSEDKNDSTKINMKDMNMKDCMDKCKGMGCKMDNCMGSSGGCKENCPMMKEHKNDKSMEHDHKTGCMKKH